jgi:hypothetical protein
MKQIHIVGSGPRTGTTLMAEAMIACFRIDQHTAHEDRVFAKPSEPTDVYLTKTVKDLLVIGPFLDLNPDLYVICMIRDPRDMVVSRHGKDPDTYWAGLRYWNTYIPAWRRVRHHPRLITVKYEDLVTDPDGTQASLVAAMPFLDKTGPFSRYHEVADPSDRSLTAKNHLPRVAGQIHIHGSIAQDLIEFGYEADDTWTALLTDVNPDLSPGHWPEHFTRRNLVRRKLPAYARIAMGRVRRRFSSAAHPG